MTSADWRRRRDVKTQDREKSLSPLDKDHLKKRCLERVRNERSRLMARMRGRGVSEEELPKGSLTLAAIPVGTAVQGGSPSSPGYSLSSPREILRRGLNEIAGGNKKRARGHHDPKQQTGSPRRQPRDPSFAQANAAHIDAREDDSNCERGDSCLMAIEEETAYLTACAGGRSTPQRPPPPGRWRSATPSTAVAASAPAVGNFQDPHRLFEEGGTTALTTGEEEREHKPTAMAEVDDSCWDDAGSDDFDEDNLLSPDEYLEMMRYIEEACREEDLRAEAEVLQEYELTRRLEEEAVESAISSGLDFDGEIQDDTVLCPVCKRDYLLQAGPPSASIFCACGFRLDTGGDRLGLEHLRQQLAETYDQHSTSCSADPSFVVEGAPGSDVLWSLCDGCGFARVVL